MRNLGLLALVIGCSMVGLGSQASAQTMAPGAPAAPAAVSANGVSSVPTPETVTNVIAAMPGNVFMPKVLRIKVGDTITWMNGGGFHNFNLDDASFRCAKGCDQDTPAGMGAPSRDPWSFSLKFDKAGTFPFFCEVHGGPGGDGMTGMVIVEAAPAAPATPTAPTMSDATPSLGLDRVAAAQ